MFEWDDDLDTYVATLQAGAWDVWQLDVKGSVDPLTNEHYVVNLANQGVDIFEDADQWLETGRDGESCVRTSRSATFVATNELRGFVGTPSNPMKYAVMVVFE